MRKILLSVLVGTLMTTFAFAGPQSLDKVSVPSSRAATGEAMNQGGDTIAEATLVSGIPYYACGTTVGYNDDYDEVCPYSSTSPDVVYVYSPLADIWVDLTLCDDTQGCPTLYDTKMYIYDGDLALVDCNDDACTSTNGGTLWVSALPGVEMLAGTTYYIIIDGYGGGAGQYNLAMTEGEAPPLPPECPVNTIYGQPYGEPLATGTSDIAPGYLRFDNFQDVYLPIYNLHWWGLMLYFDGGWSSCVEDPMPFLISFHMDENNMPGDQVCAYEMLVIAEDSGLLYDGYPVYYFSVDLDPFCYLENGWVSIVGAGEETCWFMWMATDEGDGQSQVWIVEDQVWGSPFPDLSFCLTWANPSEVEIPQSMQLNQNYPNPFNPFTTIDFSLTQPENVTLLVYNMAGILVTTLVDGEVAVGNHYAVFDATNLPSGVYFYRLSAGEFVETKKMVLVR